MARGLNYGYQLQANPATGGLRAYLPPAPAPTQPALADIIKQQPPPADITGFYQQQQALMDQQLKALQGYGSQLAQQQQALTRAYQSDPSQRFYTQMLSLLRQDPLAAYRDELRALYRVPQRLSLAVYGYGY